MTKFLRLTGAGLAAATAVALLAGCGSDSASPSGRGSSDVGAGSGGAGNPVTVSKPAKDVVLTSSELPAGIKTVPIPESDLQKALDQILSASDTAKVTPAECASKSKVVDAKEKLDVSKFGTVAGMAGGAIVSESVLVATADIAEMRAAFTGPCKTMKADVTTQGVDVTTEITHTVLDVPKGKASDLLVLHDTSTSKVAGQTTEDDSYVGYAQVGGYAVFVTVKTFTGTPDRALFDELLRKAVDKAAAA